MEKFIERKNIYDLFEKKYGIALEQIEKDLVTAKITTTEEEIEKFLHDESVKAGVDMDSEISFGKSIDCTASDSEKQIEESLIRFDLQLARSAYQYNGVDLKWYKDCFRIYKDKTLKFCMIARMIGKDVSVDEKLFDELDIVVEEDKIRETDVKRLFVPLHSNYKAAVKTCKKANKLPTFKESKINLHAIMSGDCTYGECLPGKNLLFNKNYFCSEEYMPLTLKQEQNKHKYIEAIFTADDLCD